MAPKDLIPIGLTALGLFIAFVGCKKTVDSYNLSKTVFSQEKQKQTGIKIELINRIIKAAQERVAVLNRIIDRPHQSLYPELSENFDVSSERLGEFFNPQEREVINNTWGKLKKYKDTCWTPVGYVVDPGMYPGKNWEPLQEGASVMIKEFNELIEYLDGIKTNNKYQVL